MKKTIAILLALLLVAPAAVSCAGDTEKPETDFASESTDAATETTVETERTRQNTPDTLPDTLDFAGAEIHILHVDADKHKEELYVEEDTGDVLDTAIYTRNLNVEERLNVKIVPIAGDPPVDAKTAVTAGVDEYHIVAGKQWQMMQQSTEGYYFNFYDLDYIDLEQPWWAQKFIDAATIGKNRLYYLTGDATLTLLMNMGVLYVNNTLFENQYGPINDLYDLVLAGDWNYDVMQTYVSGVYVDVNGDGKKDEGDTYGYSSTTSSMLDYLVGGADIRFSEMDENGYPHLVLNNERSVKFTEMLYALMYENPGTYSAPPTVEGENAIVAKFSEDTLMFLPFRAETSSLLRDMESDYAILPFPKFDEAQENYSTAVHDSTTTLSIPITNIANREATCAFLEAFAAESYRTVTDVYFSTLLKEKFARDQNVDAIFDIILDGVYFDFALLHSYALDSVGQIFRTLISKGNNNFVSEYQKKAESYDKLMEKLIEAYNQEQ